MDSAQIISYDALVVGLTRERAYVITPAVYESFLSAFDDRSPVHIDAEYARAAGFGGPVMHGAILNGFVSHFVGMVFPGANSLLLSVELRFSQPSYLGDAVLLRAKIAQRLDAHNTVVLHVSFINQTRGGTAATGRVQVKMRKA